MSSAPTGYRSRGRRSSDPNYFSNGKPGGRDDPFRRGLSGAGTRWYLRYLRHGFKPEDARRKAEDHRKIEAANGGGRRESSRGDRPRRSTSSLNENSRRSHRRSGRRDRLFKGLFYDFITEGCSPREARQRLEEYRLKKNDDRETSTDIRIAVLPKQYPNEVLTLNDLTQLEDLLIEELINTKNATKPHFNGIRRPAGFMLVDCENEDTVNWLMEIIPKIKWEGVELTSCRHADIPICQAVTLRIPKAAGEDAEKILQLIQNQNDGIEATTWKVVKVQDDEDYLELRIIIDEKSYDAIAANGGTIAYKFSKVRVAGLNNFVKEKKKEAEVAIEENKEENAEKPERIVDNADNTEKINAETKNIQDISDENAVEPIKSDTTSNASAAATTADANIPWGKWEDEEDIIGENGK